MRVTGGKAKGHRLLVPQTIADLRPSQDRVREAIFNIIGREIRQKKILDLYAGTGALGIEALSRGARTCDFVEKSREACEIIQKNLTHTYLEGKSDIYQTQVASFLQNPHHERYDFIFLDPPYAEQPRNVIRLLPNFMSPLGLLLYLHGKRIVLTNAADREWISQKLEIVDNRKYGQTHLSILKLRPTT